MCAMRLTRMQQSNPHHPMIDHFIKETPFMRNWRTTGNIFAPRAILGPVDPAFRHTLIFVAQPFSWVIVPPPHKGKLLIYVVSSCGIEPRRIRQWGRDSLLLLPDRLLCFKGQCTTTLYSHQPSHHTQKASAR